MSFSALAIVVVEGKIQINRDRSPPHLKPVPQWLYDGSANCKNKTLPITSSEARVCIGFAKFRLLVDEKYPSTRDSAKRTQGVWGHAPRNKPNQ
ncbi:hypothetical protein TRICI_003380 [Trichomonascus ciferrii]|uniref:Uncharacterized protein n=1 Tax=Trichomonascus ciferrii TaxID=44093 RepID=A0A642V456_9ASCO|nr:hypothetical protein TRICI_003380 [Trichomonascus ciferrii]